MIIPTVRFNEYTKKFAFADLAKANLLKREVTPSYHRRSLVRIAAEEMKISLYHQQPYGRKLSRCLVYSWLLEQTGTSKKKKGKNPFY